MKLYVKKSGRLGNNLIQYFFGKILSENITDSKLYTDFELPSDFGLENHYHHEIDTYRYSTLKEVWSGYDCSLFLDNIEISKDLNSILKAIKDNNKNLIVSGYFQQINYYESYRDYILQKFDFKRIKSDFVGMHIRKGDIVNSENDLPDSWFLEMANKFQNKKILITTDSPNHSLINRLVSMGCELYNNSPERTIIDFSGFEEIVLSQGTFSWWMGFLSDGKKHNFLSKSGWCDRLGIYKMNQKNWIYYKQEDII